jgi:hypothetical protein
MLLEALKASEVRTKKKSPMVTTKKSKKKLLTELLMKRFRLSAIQVRSTLVRGLNLRGPSQSCHSVRT